MTTAMILLAPLALLLGIAGGFLLGKAPPRPPRTDEEHAENVAGKAWALNLAMHHARAAGLNPTLKVAPIDDELEPGGRPIIAGVERIPLTREQARAQMGEAARMIEKGTHPIDAVIRSSRRKPSPIGERRFSKFFDDRYVEVVKYVDDDNWWFTIVGEQPPRVAKAETALSKMPRTREEAYAR